MTVPVTLFHPGYDPGFIPGWLSESDPRPAKEQIHAHYAHGGGWQDFEGFELKPDLSIKYPDDPAYRPRATMKLRKELIVMYDHAWVAIIAPDRSFAIARID